MDRPRIEEAAWADCRARGCTCDRPPLVISHTPERVDELELMIRVEHDEGCPLWTDESVHGPPPPRDPDSVVKVEEDP